MRRAIRLGICSLALAAGLAACRERDVDPGPLGDAAQRAWDAYNSAPGADTYQTFLKSNRAAADRHGRPEDRIGVEYQIRALEAMADHAVREHDVSAADDVIERAREIESHDLVGVYDEVRPGFAARLAASKARAAPLVR